MPAPSTQPASPPGRAPHRPGRQPGGRRRGAPGVMASSRRAPVIPASTAPGAGPRLSRGGGPLIEVGLLRSDPQLAARLSVFDRLCAGQAMPAWEQVSSRHDRIRQAAA